MRKTLEQKAARNNEIRWKWRETDMSLKEIAQWVEEKYGEKITKQRIWAIVSEYRPKSKKKIAKTNKES